MRLVAFELIIIPIFLLSTVGMLYNANINSGFKNGDNYVNCGGFLDLGASVTCFNQNSTGLCTYNQTCALGTPQLLSQTSPFTPLLQGNVLAFLGTITAITTPNQNVWQILGLNTGTLYNGGCVFKYIGNMTSGPTYITTVCTMTNERGENLTRAQSPQWPSAFNRGNGSFATFFQLGIQNASQYQAGTYLQSSNCLSLASQSNGAGGYTGIMDGCQYYSTDHRTNQTSYWYFNSFLNGSIGGTLALSHPEYHYATCSTTFGLNGTYCPSFLFPSTIQLENWDTFDCGRQFRVQGGAPFHYDYAKSFTPNGPYHYYDPQKIGPITKECQNVFANIAAYNVAASNPWGQISWFLLFLGGILLFVIASGVNFQFSGSIFGNGTGMGAGSNAQGTRLAQALGLFLMTWIPLYSEFGFGSWLNSAVLPLGVDVFITTIFFAMNFLGIYWMVVSISAGGET